MKIFMVIIISMLVGGCNAIDIKQASSGVGSITIKPGEEVLVGVKIVDEHVIEVNQVSEDGEITFKLSKMNSGIMLSGKNTLKNAIKYDVYMVDTKGGKIYISSCPMLAGVGLFESWPHKIPKLVINNFRILPEGSDMACR